MADHAATIAPFLLARHGLHGLVWPMRVVQLPEPWRPAPACCATLERGP